MGPASSTPIDGHRKGVAKWLLIMVCVCLGHTNMSNQGWTQDHARFPALDHRREFRGRNLRTWSVIACTRVEDIHASEVGTVSHIVPHNLTTCARDTMHSFLGTSRHRRPTSAETLDHGPRVVYPHRRASIGGSKVTPYIGLCLFRSYQHAKTRLEPRPCKIPRARPKAEVSVQKSAHVVCYRMNACGGYTCN